MRAHRVLRVGKRTPIEKIKMKEPILTLTIQQASQEPIPTRATLRRWVLAALGTQKKVKSAEITLRFVDAEEGRELNRTYRGKDYATNVLTFIYAQEKHWAGDIVLCMPVVLQEAGNRPWRAHCAHLVVHGVLHLLGFDHENDTDAQKMEARETAILAHLGYPDPYR